MKETGSSKRVNKLFNRAVLIVITAVFLCSCASNAGVDTQSTDPMTTTRGAISLTEPVTTEPETTIPVPTDPFTSETDPETSFMTEETSETVTEDYGPFPRTTEPIRVDSSALYSDYKKKSGGRVALYDLTDDELLFSAGGFLTKIYPASVTKLFTITYARTILRLDHILTIGKEINLVSSGSSRAGIKIGERYRFGEILYSLLLPSGNDVAYAIAAECGKVISNDFSLSARKAVSAFITGLNQFLKELGVKKTKIVTPDGVADVNHFTCLHDLILISKLVLSDEVLSKVVSTISYTVIDEDGGEHSYSNTNPFLKRSGTYIGIKTGGTKLAGHCIIVAQKHDDGHTRIAYVFAAENVYTRKYEVEGLMDFGYNKATGKHLPAYTNPPSPPSTPKETTKKPAVTTPSDTSSDVTDYQETSTDFIPITENPEDTQADHETDVIITVSGDSDEPAPESSSELDTPVIVTETDPPVSDVSTTHPGNDGQETVDETSAENE